MAPVSGWVTEIDTSGIGKAALILGAGRSKKGEGVDLAVGLEVLVKPGDRVEIGQPLAIIHGNAAQQVQVARAAVVACYTIGDSRIEPLPLICGSVGEI